MPGITQAMCTSFKGQILQAVHNFNVSGGSTFKLALYSAATATLDATTTAYTATGEISGTGYTAGGGTLSKTGFGVSTSGTTGFTSFANLTFSTATITADGALIYNSSGTPTNAAVAVLNFGGTKTSSAGDFTIIFPTNDAATAIIRIA